MKKNKPKSCKVFFRLMYILFFLLVICILIFFNRESLGLFISKFLHKQEIAFVKNFLHDFKNTDLENLSEYFLNSKTIEILKYLEKYDNDLQKRDYFIEGIATNDDGDKTSLIKLSTNKNGKKLSWIELVIIYRNYRYYIFKVQISINFPLPSDVF